MVNINYTDNENNKVSLFSVGCVSCEIDKLPHIREPIHKMCQFQFDFIRLPHILQLCTQLCDSHCQPDY